MNVWYVVWAVWIGMVAGSFGVIEGLALKRKRQPDTLSEFVWFILKLSRWVWGVALVTFIAFATWLGFHFWGFGVV